MKLLPYLESEAALARFMDAFEQGTLPREQWTHTAHLAVAAWYLSTLSEPEAIDRVRTGILRYNECVGTQNTEDSGYHETITLFWLGMAREHLGRCPVAEGVLERVRQVVNAFGSQRDLFRQYYSFDVVASREARRKWVAPDLIAHSFGNKNRSGDI